MNVLFVCIFSSLLAGFLRRDQCPCLPMDLLWPRASRSTPSQGRKSLPPASPPSGCSRSRLGPVPPRPAPSKVSTTRATCRWWSPSSRRTHFATQHVASKNIGHVQFVPSDVLKPVIGQFSTRSACILPLFSKHARCTMSPSSSVRGECWANRPNSGVANGGPTLKEAAVKVKWKWPRVGAVESASRSVLGMAFQDYTLRKCITQTLQSRETFGPHARENISVCDTCAVYCSHLLSLARESPISCKRNSFKKRIIVPATLLTTRLMCQKRQATKSLMNKKVNVTKFSIPNMRKH